MDIEIHPSKLQDERQLTIIIVDFFMMGLIIINLVWILFDSLFASSTVQSLLGEWVPQFFEFYRDTLHADFILYDMVFVSIFIFELLIRWFLAVIHKTYHRWFFYPFIHWYDVLGCIPIGSFRFLRLLRLVSILYRLQKYGIVDLSKSYPFRFAKKYFGVLVEEVSDRVVVKVLKGLQSEVESGTPVVHRITREVLLPNKTLFTEWIVNHILGSVVAEIEGRELEIRSYLNSLIGRTLSQHSSLSKLSALPLFGRGLSSSVEQAVEEVIYHLLRQIVEDAKGGGEPRVIEELIEGLLISISSSDSGLSEAVKKSLLHSMGLIIEEVEIQKWKLAESID